MIANGEKRREIGGGVEERKLLCKGEGVRIKFEEM
jgi:hypothetical protein